MNLYQVQLKKAQEEIDKVQAEKMGDEAGYATTKARSIAGVIIVREEGRRVGLREALTRRRGIDYIDRGHGYEIEGSMTITAGQLKESTFTSSQDHYILVVPMEEVEAAKLRESRTHQTLRWC